MAVIAVIAATALNAARSAQTVIATESVNVQHYLQNVEMLINYIDFIINNNNNVSY